MKDKYVIIDLRNMDFMKNKEGKINYYDTEEEACLTCGMYEFEDAWVMKLIYNHIEYRNISETPDNWVILKLPNGWYKVFGTWSGESLDGDRWKLNSGISKVEQDKNFYYFTGVSGSVYKCNKNKYGTASAYGHGIMLNIIEQSGGQIELMEEMDDFDNYHCLESF
jgi:hypothetical protein